MAILSGRTGVISYDPTGIGGAGLVPLISVNTWTLSQETEYEDVSCYGDTNRVYLPGLADLSGELSGFWNADDVTLWQAASAPTPGWLKLQPNDVEPDAWQGLAYLDASIDCSLAAPKVSGNFKAAGSWTTPGSAVATGATAGTPGTFTPPGAAPPANLAGMTGIVATPTTAWTTGQHVVLGDASHAYWNATAWTAGDAA
jgi:hypothetical protein